MKMNITNFKLKLRYKIQAIIITVSAIIFLGAIGYISFKAKNEAYTNTIRLIDAQSDKYSNQIKGLINEDFAVVRTLGNAFKAYDYMPKEEWQGLIKIMYKEVFRAHPTFYQLWDSWELQHIDTSWTKPYGRIANTIIRENNNITLVSDLRSLDGDPELYKKNKSRPGEFVTDIYTDVFSTSKAGKKLMASLEQPIRDSGKFIGLVGLDVTLEQFQDIVSEIKIKDLEGSYAFLLSHNAIFAGHPETDSLNKKAAPNPTKNEDFNLHDKIKTGKNFNAIHNKKNQKERYVTYSPIKIGKTDTYWYMAISAPLDSIKAQANKNFKTSLFVGLIGLIILAFVIYLVAKNITTPIEKVTYRLNQLAKGRIDQNMKLELATGDEIENMANALNTSIEGLNTKNIFAQKLGKGELDYEFSLTSEEDELGQSLIEMRNSLKKAREEEEKRKIEDERRQWANEGLAKFADILRQNNNDIKELGYDVVKNMVKYLDANQGGIFIKNDNDQEDVQYELVAAYAYNRRKYLEKTYKPGEGLVGTCAQEKKPKYLEELPQDYINITSGLGKANPTSLFIVPLKTEEEVVGVLELASFNKLEQYQKDFVEKVAETIASTIASVKINMRTNELLEKSQQQAEEMSSQEEEMRQNMEELQATQEEAARRENEMSGIIEAVDSAVGRLELDIEGNILKANPVYCRFADLDEDALTGKNISHFMDPEKSKSKEFLKLWEDLKKGKKHSERHQYFFNQKEKWLYETFVPIKDESQEYTKIMVLSNDISYVHQLEEENKKLKNK